MNNESKDRLALATVIAGYLSIATVVVRRFLHPPSALPSGGVARSRAAQFLLRAPLTDENLQSLSPGSPGRAAMDELASRAAAEERGEERREGTAAIASMPARATSVATPSLPPESDAVAEVLRHQSLDSRPLPEWKRPVGDRLPVPTFAPAVMAFGIVLFAMGLATVWYVCLAGSLVFAVAAWRWAGELQGE